MAQKKYSIPSNAFIGEKAINQFNQFLKTVKYKQFFVLCDSHTLNHCLPLLIANSPAIKSANIFEIEPGEPSKCLAVAEQIWLSLLEQKAGNDTLIINLGGGVVCDLGGFCASVFKRGIDYVNIPTSLLAMVDAAIGGKTAVDLNNIKNIIGSFYPAKAVFIDPIFLITLPNREMKNGLAEVIKMALINDKSFWTTLNKPDTTIHDEFISKAIAIKHGIVSKDPFDKGIRQTLNYGHSIAHAIEAHEAEKKDPILHGEAVVIGMIVENHIAKQLKMLDQASMDEINNFLFKNFKPKAISENEIEILTAYLHHDKKNTNTQLKFSLLNKIGKCQIQVPVKPNHIQKALQYYVKLVK